VVLAATVWLVVDAFAAQAQLRSAAREVGGLEELVLADDDAGVAAALTRLQEHASQAVGSTDGPHWWLAARAPVVGPTVDAVQTVAHVVHGLAVDALPRLADVAAVIDPTALAPRGGRVELQPLVDAAPGIIAADTAVQAALARLAEIDSRRVLPPVAAPLAELRRTVSEAGSTTSTAARAAQLLPPMLGAEGTRRYLLVVQTNAEIRSTGGFPGAVLLLTAENGAIELGTSVAGSSLSSREPVVALAADEEAVYTSRLAKFFGSTNLTPDFPRAAELMVALWRASGRQEVDGVVAVDPVALQGMLRASGPVRTSSGVQLTGENAADVLLHEVYRRLPEPSAQDAFFGDAAGAVFRGLMRDHARPDASLRALADSAARGRVLVWSARPREQELLADTVLSGRLRGEDNGSPVVGVYLNDGSAAKMSYFLEYPVRVEREACRDDGRRTLSATLELGSTAPGDAADLPPYLTGGGLLVPAGVVRTNVAVYAPEGGWVEDVWVGDEKGGFAAYVHDGLSVVVRTVDLAPGEVARLRATLVTGPDQPEPVRVRVTPGARETNVTVVDSGCGD
jgi:hypothetical protein